MSIRGKHGIAASVPAMPLIQAGTLIAFILASSGAYAGSAPPAIAAGGVPDPAVTGLARPPATAAGVLKRGLAWARSQPMFEPRLAERDKRLGSADRENRSAGEAEQAENLSQ